MDEVSLSEMPEILLFHCHICLVRVLVEEHSAEDVVERLRATDLAEVREHKSDLVLVDRFLPCK